VLDGWSEWSGRFEGMWYGVDGLGV
jgi:hypothetical protein